MRNRYTGERELPTIVPCPVPVMKGSLNLEILIESVDGVRMEDMNFTLRFYTWGSALKFSLGKEQLYKAKGRYYARLNERDFRNGWLMCDVEIRESNEGDCGCFVKPLLLRCNTGLILNGGSNSPCPTDSYHEGWMNGYKVQFRLADVLPLPDIEIPDKAIAEVIDSMKNANVLGYFTHESLLKEQEVASVAFVGDVKDAHTYFYYVPGTEPDGYQPGWNDMSAVLGTYDLTADQISIYDFHLLTEYNVSHNHVHTTRVFSTDWGVTTRYYKEFPDWTEGKTYTACSKVNMAGYTEHSFMANRDTKEAPFKVVEDTNEFSFEEAIVLVPKEYRFPGMKVTFINSMTHQAETWYFKGGTWENVGNWQKIDFGVGEDQITAEEAFREKFETMELTADRAIADEHGNRIPDTYVRREAVTNYIRSIYQELFITYPPNIMEGYITPEMLSEAVKDMLAASGATITNLPDEEDLTDVHGVLKLKDKDYNPNTYSGFGRKILRKNMVNGVNVLTQRMISKPNTIYVIQYDYDLQGTEITVPENCVLDFQGGISNGTIIHNNTLYSGNISYRNVNLYGKCYNEFNEEITLYKFNKVPKNTKLCATVESFDNLERLVQNAYHCGINNTIIIIRGNYNPETENIDKTQDLESLFKWVKEHNISVEGIKFHIDESMNFNSAPYNTTSYIDKYFNFVKSVTELANKYIVYDKIWIINEHDAIFSLNDLFSIWKNNIDSFVSYGKTINKESWISFAGYFAIQRNNNHFNYNISVNYYPCITKFKKELSYNKDIVKPIVDELTYFKSRTKNKEFIISECGTKPIEGALISPQNWRIQGEYDYDIFDIFYGLIRKVIDNSQIDIFCIWYIERMDEENARNIVYNHLIL